MDAPDPQEAESGCERQRLVQFSIFWSQMIAFGYVPLLDYAGLKNLNVWSLGTPLVSMVSSITFRGLNCVKRPIDKFITLKGWDCLFGSKNTPLLYKN